MHHVFMCFGQFTFQIHSPYLDIFSSVVFSVKEHVKFLSLTLFIPIPLGKKVPWMVLMAKDIKNLHPSEFQQ